MWGRQRPSINITLSSLSAIRDTCEGEGAWHTVLSWSYSLCMCMNECFCVPTSAPRRLSEHILQKDSRACWKAGDNFLRHRNQRHTRRQKKKQSMQSVPLSLCTLQQISLRAQCCHSPMSLLCILVEWKKPIERWMLATRRDRVSGARGWWWTIYISAFSR